MLSNLRPNSQLYILHKEASPYIEVATVQSVSTPKPKFPLPQQFGQPQEMVVDIVARVAERTINISVPANLDIANSTDNASMVITASRDAMNNEVSSLRQYSTDILASIDRHKEIIAACDKILESINPEYAEKQAQAQEISGLKQQMGAMSQTLSELMAMLKGGKACSEPLPNSK